MPAYPTTGYMNAELCLNGHVITGDMENEPEKRRSSAENVEPRPFALARNVVFYFEVITFTLARSLG
jgi:hypothetical protein